MEEDKREMKSLKTEVVMILKPKIDIVEAKFIEIWIVSVEYNKNCHYGMY